MDASWAELTGGEWGVRVYASDADVLAGLDATDLDAGTEIDVRSLDGRRSVVAVRELVSFDRRSAIYTVGVRREPTADEVTYERQARVKRARKSQSASAKAERRAAQRQMWAEMEAAMKARG